MRGELKLYIRFAVALIGYTVALIVFRNLWELPAPFKYAAILFPIMALAYLGRVLLDAFDGLDEMWRRIVGEGFLFSAVATGLTCFSYSIFRDAGAVELKGEWVFYMVIVYYVIGSVWVARRY